MNIELDENGYTKDGKWKLVPVEHIEKREYKRSGEIQIDDDLLPEFAEMWCRSCGDVVPSHLKNCPTLMSKI